jgi:hypothetical protein
VKEDVEMAGMRLRSGRTRALAGMISSVEMSWPTLSATGQTDRFGEGFTTVGQGRHA